MVVARGRRPWSWSSTVDFTRWPVARGRFSRLVHDFHGLCDPSGSVLSAIACLKEVVNNIEKHQKSVPKVRKQRPRGGQTFLLGLFGSHVAPQCPRGRFFEDSRPHVGGHFGPEFNEI